MNRKIGAYGGFAPGPLFLVFGGVHGNEPAGIQAIEQVFRVLAEQEPASQSEETFRGTLVGLIGNVQASGSGKRFVSEDLNRSWSFPHLHQIEQQNPLSLEAEDREMVELLAAVRAEVRASQPDRLILLDLHTTSATGGIFCIPLDDAASLDLAKALHTPVILGLLDGIQGTLLQFAAAGHFGVRPEQVVGVAFEAGQHHEPDSVSRCVAAIFHSLSAAGCMPATEADRRYEAGLRADGSHLPQVTRLRHVHRVRPGSQFKMRPGYINFQPVRQGELLADDTNGPIPAPCDGLILMPLYQPQGADGFFIVTEVNDEL